MKADKNFKFSKSSKRVMSSTLDKEQRLAYKKAMIDAELSFEYSKKIKVKDKPSD